ncbi:uncharacterized protein LOC133832387 [Humulus lupulus]|uniref:uncharacterized protein LOC133832387 n=1 Tax=Humulus lupulus TaxID=3486 RepID=UPI002B402B20|nr:uncharacterized protein LOC133832387 [Humulus lupulus]
MHFFKRKIIEDQQFGENGQTSIPNPENLAPTHPKKVQRNESEIFDIAYLERDPEKRPPIWEYPINQQDEIRRAYIKVGPYQIKLESYPPFGSKEHLRRFCSSWFELFPLWLEYSPSVDAVFCLPCYLFSKPTRWMEANNFFLGGFKNWKNVNNGNNGALLRHVVKWLAFQACAFQGRDQSKESINRGNFHELLKLLASYNDKAPLNATYTSLDIQKEILYILSNKVKKEIRQEIGVSKFCIIVDEALDVSKREQMALVLIFVDKEGFIHEQFFGVVHLRDTTALALEEGIVFVLSQHNLVISNIHRQGYDGASNMRGVWNGLQALICNECPYAYYIHCLAHCHQLALVAASREVSRVHQFFSTLIFIIIIVTASCKRNDELKEAQSVEFATKIANYDIESGTGLNQIGTLKRAGDTRWGSHLGSISSLLKMFNATCVVLSKIAKEKVSYSQRGDADFACNQLLSFEFVFILHLMKEILEITHILYVALQRQSQDILNVELLVLSSAFDLRDGFKLCKIDDICKLAEKFCPNDFLGKEVNLSSIHELCQGLVKIRKAIMYPLIDRLLRLVLTLPVSTATTERASSIMKIIKTKLRNKMEDSFFE